MPSSKARNLADLLGGGGAGVPSFSGTGAIDVPAGTTAERPSNPNSGYVRFNTDLDQLEQYTVENGWQGIAPPPTITSTDTNSLEEADTTQTIVITGQNFDTGATATLVDANGTIKNPTTSVRNSSSQITLTYSGGDILDGTVAEPLSVKVNNASGLAAELSGAISIDARPVWNTSNATALATLDVGTTMSTISLSATDPEGGTINYSVTSGALPNGLSMNSNGGITGTPVSSDYVNGSPLVTHNFTVTADDQTGNTTNRAFSIIRKWYDGSTSALAAPSTDHLYDLDVPNGVYYFDRGLGVFQNYFHKVRNRGWSLVWNLNAHGPVNSDYRGWYTTDFWRDAGNYEGNPTTNTNPYGDWYKSASHDKYDNVSEILIVAHDAGSPSFDNLGFVNEGSTFGDSSSRYVVNSSNNTKTLQQMMQTTNNVITGESVERVGGVVGFDYGSARLGGEPFIDAGRRIVFKLEKDNTLGADGSDPNTNRAWFGTDQSASSGEINHNGHVLYGGFGGYHIRNGSYPLEFTAAVNQGYHPGQTGLGLSHRNPNSSYTVFDQNPQAANVQMVDFAIYVR